MTPANAAAAPRAICSLQGPHSAIAHARPLLALLEALLPVRFDEARQSRISLQARRALRVQLLAADDDGQGAGGGEDAQAERVPSLRVSLWAAAAHEDALMAVDVRFADDPAVPWPLRGRTLRTRASARAPLAAPPGGTRVLATCGGEPWWTVEERAGTAHHRSAFALPALAEGQGFADVFNGQRFIELLPLLHLLRIVSGEAAFVAPPLRAAFMVDDPNLHWPSYGHVDYRVLSRQAARHRYHVCFATVPADTWFTHAATAAIFREHPSTLSLTVHGNDHARNELSVPRSAPGAVALLQQALRRIRRLEAAAGVSVSRVMVPPHGACSAAMLALLPALGFDGACLSTGSLRAHNPGAPWHRTAGYAPAEWVQSCPVMPRWGLGGEPRNALLLAAYLGQALVLRVHQQDLRGGPALFDEWAGFINGLGDVHWSGMASLAARGAAWRREGDICRVRPFGRRVELTLDGGWPRGAVEVEPRPGVRWHCIRSDAPGLPALTIEAAAPAEPDESAPPRRRPALAVRRLLAEARDRLSVMLPGPARAAAVPGLDPRS
ncbi:hypothetical protein V4F39_22460 [Aquincola sp. MAHUQ-54]|uniref:Uncharacterized protein n=1 Tax=Aquincola agrisoli TaxID=3119538 RepID=A0AAW9QM65_9BURK